MNIKKKVAVAVSIVLITLTSPLSFTADNSVSAETEIWDGTSDTSWYDEEETELHISTAEELAGLAQLVNNGQSLTGQTIYLENDIYLNDISNYESWGAKSPANEWAPIPSLSGTLDGNGHTIYGMYISKSESYSTANLRSEDTFAGFCRICKGNICNLNMDSTYIEVTQSGYISVGMNYSDYDMCGAGSICGYCMYGSVYNCTVSGNIQITLKPYSTMSSNFIISAVGGIAGKNTGTIAQCASYVNISAEIKHDYYCKGELFAGGICGSGGYSIEQCKNAGTINCLARNSNDIAFVGGICGYNPKTCSIDSCYNEGNLEGSVTGGIIGGTYESMTIKNSYNVGADISGNLSGGVSGGFRYLGVYNSYYLDSTALTAIIYNKDTTGAKSSTDMQEESFAKSLGEAFVYKEGGYPLLAWEVQLQPESLIGDINLDGIFDIADIKLLQDYLVCRETFTAEQGKIADVCSDDELNVFDLCVLKRLYMNQTETV